MVNRVENNYFSNTVRIRRTSTI